MLLAHFLDHVLLRGDLRLIDARGKQWRFGDGAPPRATIRLHKRSLHWRLAVNPKLVIGEAFMDGTLTVEQGSLYDLLDLLSSNLDSVEGHFVQSIGTMVGRTLRFLQQYNPVGKAQRNVAHHYDLSDELYDLFLDDDRQYSCAYFNSEHDSLEQAQLNKKCHLAAKLLLNKPGLKLLEIGSGWGGLAMYLAQQGAACVDGVTLSIEQQKVSTRRAVEAGLDDRVKFDLLDYREQDGKYDRIVSVGMFEHVGAGHYVEFFKKLSDLMTDDGVCVLHSIGRNQPPGNTNAWLRKYIFPGGYTPALSEVMQAIEKAGLWVADIEILRLHYANTLRIWHQRFMSRRDEAVALYDERFCRMWEFYLVGCELAFRHMGQMVFQLQIAKRQDAVPLTRDYIADWECGIAASSQAAE